MNGSAPVGYSLKEAVIRGSGAPNGVVIGSVGDRYVDTAATLGARVWYKASGAGTNTGWLVAEGDTGQVNVVANIVAGYTASSMYIRRIDKLISLRWDGLAFAGSASPAEATFYNIPTGYQLSSHSHNNAVRGNLSRAGSSNNFWYYYIAANAIKASIAIGSNTSADTFRGSLTWITDDAWPS